MRPRHALRALKQHAEKCAKGEILDNLKANQLKNLLSVVSKRVIKDANQRVIGNGNLIKGTLKNLENRLKTIPREAFNTWKQFAAECSKGEMLDNIRAQKLEKTLKTIPLRSSRDAVQRVIGQGDKVLGALKHLENKLKMIPRQAFNRWRGFVARIKAGSMFDNLRGHRLLQKLQKIPLRTLRDAKQRVEGSGNKILGALKDIENHMKKIPRDALRQWKKYAEDIKTGGILDNLRAHKLKSALAGIPLRTLKDSKNRVVGQGDMVTGVLKSLDAKIKNIPRQALQRWRKYVNNIKTGGLFDNLRAQKLAISLTKIAQRTIKGGQNSVSLYGNKIQSIFEKLDGICIKQKRAALSNWNKYVQKCKNGELLDGIRAQKL